MTERNKRLRDDDDSFYERWRVDIYQDEPEKKVQLEACRVPLPERRDVSSFDHARGGQVVGQIDGETANRLLSTFTPAQRDVLFGLRLKRGEK